MSDWHLGKSSALHCSTSLLYLKRCWIQATLRNLNGTDWWDEWFLSFLTRNICRQRKVRNCNKQRNKKRKSVLEGVNMILKLQQVKNPIVWKISFVTLLWAIERNNTAHNLCSFKFVSLQKCQCPLKSLLSANLIILFFWKSKENILLGVLQTFP